MVCALRGHTGRDGIRDRILAGAGRSAEADTEYDDLGSRIRAQSLEIGARMLVVTLVDVYGEAAYPQLVEWLGEADSLPHWLTLSLGVSADEIADLEAEWYARYADTLVEMGYEIEY